MLSREPSQPGKCGWRLLLQEMQRESYFTFDIPTLICLILYQFDITIF